MNYIGSLRRSRAAHTAGPGAVVDFRAGGGAPVSVIAAGLDEWEKRERQGHFELVSIQEPRLQKLLHVSHFKLPPAPPEEPSGGEVPEETLTGVRFPGWLLCPECDILKPVRRWTSNPGDPAPYCAPCTSARDEDRRVNVIPARFIVTCERGHIDEFPWNHWVGHKEQCSGRGYLRLTNPGKGAGLRGLILSCTECEASRSMAGCFAKEAFEGQIQCSGRRPWLVDADEDCDLPPRAVLRGASNLYFPLVDSAIDIPPWSEAFQKRLGHYWEDLRRAENSRDRRELIRLTRLHERLDMSLDDLAAEVEQRIGMIAEATEETIRRDEYKSFAGLAWHHGDSSDEFQVSQESVPVDIAPWIERVARVTRLREVRALRGFTRLTPPESVTRDDERICALSTMGNPQWLPAVEVRGEGIFLELADDGVREWEHQSQARERAGELDSRWQEYFRQRFDAEPDREITPRFLLIHSLAHALMRQLTIECGYSTASLRERLYVGDGEMLMAGLLIYTATTDADGTLGGLSRQGEAQRIGPLLEDAIESMEWCSSDPLCITGQLTISEPMNMAACHCCQLAPETSCEEFNRFLDRAMLVGTPDEPEVGYFRPMIENM